MTEQKTLSRNDAQNWMAYLLLTVVYIVSGKLGLVLALPPGYASPLFPPAGIAVAAALIGGRRTLPWIFMGSLLLNLWVGHATSHQMSSVGLMVAIAIATASTLQASTGGWLLRRAIAYPTAFDHVSEILWFLLLAPVMCLICSTLSVGSLWALGSINTADVFDSWISWWIGDSIGVVVMLPIVMTIFAQPRDLWRKRIGTVAVPMLLVSALFVGIFLKTNQWEYDNSLSDFKQLSEQTLSLVVAKLDEQNAVLDEMAGLLLHDEHGHVSRDEFHRFVQRSLKRFPMIRALEWVPLVSASERDDFEAEQRNALPGFEIRERNEEGRLVRAKVRARYYPVTYVEPLAGNEAAVGFDLASDVKRSEALNKALQSDTVVTTEAVHLVQDTQHQAGILMLSAIFPHNDQFGVVLTVLRMSDFMGKLLSNTRPMVFTRLTDVDQQQVLFTDFPNPSATVLNEHRFTFGTRHYLLETTPTPLYFTQHRSWQSFAVLGFGLLGTGLLGALLLLGTGYTARIENQVRDRTRELSESESRFRYMLENSPISVRIANHAGTHVVFSNQSYAELVESPPDQVNGLNPRLYYANPHFYDEVIEQISRGDKVTNKLVELKIPGEHAKTKWALASYLRLEYQNEAAVLGWFYDITESKLSEMEMRIAATAFETHEGMLVTDAHTRILRTNRAFTTITGYSAEEVIGKKPSILSSGRQDKDFYQSMWERIHNTGSWDGEIWNRRKNGEIYPEHLTINVVKDRDGNITNYVGALSDSTERQKTLEQLRTAATELEIANNQIEIERASLAKRVAERTAQLEYANKAKDSFLATMSHEIRTPLGGMLGMMELLNLSELNARQRQQLKTAQLSGKNLLRIVNDILDWSKIEAGKLELSPQRGSINDVLHSVASTYAQLAGDKGITLEVSVDPQLSAGHCFDALRLSQILNNFTSNAVKFTQHGSIEIGAQRLGSREGFETVRFSVKDSGHGIDKEQQSRLFQQYEQATVDTARMYGGTGLGLAICRRLAELMGGELGVESTIGVGSTFHFTISLPVVAERNPIENATIQAANQATTHQAGETEEVPLTVDGRPLALLIVDDHPVNRMLLKQQLVMLGAKVETAESGVPALTLWQSSQHFDIIITDCHMPEMDGYELAGKIRIIEAQAGTSMHIPIIAWTANVLSDEVERCQAAGMDDFLTKPTELDDLRAMLVKWMNRT